ncbi:MAG: hypothetical protein SGBAC_003618 [Bacillariaceae sp.]
MYVAPVQDEEERRANNSEFAASMSDWTDFQETTMQVYGVNMGVLQKDFEKEQKEYYLWSSRWRELPSEAVLDEPKVVKTLDMMTCTLEESKGIMPGDAMSTYDFSIDGSTTRGPVSGIAGWFTSDFKTRTDAGGIDAPKLPNPSFLSTGPENGYTHWGQQVFYFQSGIPLLNGETTQITGSLEMIRTKENARLYNTKLKYTASRKKSDGSGQVLMKSPETEQLYLIP